MKKINFTCGVSHAGLIIVLYWSVACISGCSHTSPRLVLVKKDSTQIVVLNVPDTLKNNTEIWAKQLEDWPRDVYHYHDGLKDGYPARNSERYIIKYVNGKIIR